MPRRKRLYLPGLPYHIVQRCNNREACFIEPGNYQFYRLKSKEKQVQSDPTFLPHIFTFIICPDYSPIFYSYLKSTL